MNSSTGSKQRGARSTSGALPFSIDHILSSPIKQAAVQAAVSQQQAAAAAAAAAAMAAANNAAALSLHEQLALQLAASHQQPHHLFANPANLLTHTMALPMPLPNQQQAQHQPDQLQAHQWQQQQQLMAAASLAMSQGPLNPLAAATSQAAPDASSSSNFLSYFMACMLLQQQQHQDTQIHQQQPPQMQLNHNQHRHIQRHQTTHHQPQSLQTTRQQQHSNRQPSLSPLSHQHTATGNQQRLNKSAPVPLVNSPSGRQDQPTALSSLSSFVSETLSTADQGANSSTLSAKKEHKSTNLLLDHHNTTLKHATNNNSNSRISADRKCSQENQPGSQSPSRLDLIASQGLPKSTVPPPAPVIAAAASVNTTLAKAPTELVQKQPAWVFCTRYSDRPSSGPRTRRAKSKDKRSRESKPDIDEKRPRTAFTSEQLEKLRLEFQANSYLDEKRRKELAEKLCLNENQIKIWFQNKRAKMKKQNNQPNPLRGLLVAGGLYNHSTATSDCSESYANGNEEVDHENDDEDNECLRGVARGLESAILAGSANSQKKAYDSSRFIGGDNDNKEARAGGPATKRARLMPQRNGSNSGSASDSDSRQDDLDEDERLISVN